MEKKLYTCQFCKKEFEPARRKVQKFCSATCRSKNHHHKNKVASINAPKINLSQQLEEIKNKKTKVEEMSWAGVKNAAGGTLIIEGAKALYNVLKSDENKPVNKGDIQELKDLINTRYFLVHNINPDPFGRKAYFDMATSRIKYYNESQKTFELPIVDL